MLQDQDQDQDRRISVSIGLETRTAVSMTTRQGKPVTYNLYWFSAIFLLPVWPEINVGRRFFRQQCTLNERQSVADRIITVLDIGGRHILLLPVTRKCLCSTPTTPSVLLSDVLTAIKLK